MKYLFILGRNIDLSIAEIESFLKKENNPIIKKKLNQNGLLISVERPLEFETINRLGGTLSIGNIIVEGKGKDLFNKMEKIMIYTGESNKLSYAVWNFSSLWDDCTDYLKERFKSEKLKTNYKGLTGSIESQDGEIEQKPSSKVLDEEYFIFEEEGEQYFGKIIQRCNYQEIEKRDMEKPIRRESLAIAPRLAKILINLSGLKRGDKLFDPFCGVGGIIQEALLQDIDVIGSDIDGAAIQGARQNMKWFGFSEDRFQLIHFDSTKVNIPEVDAIATEPDLGDTLKKIPTKDKAKNTLKNFEILMVKVINNAKDKVKGKIVFTSPYIRTGKKRLSCDIDNICKRTGYRLSRDPIPEFRDRQIVGRMIYILTPSK